LKGKGGMRLEEKIEKSFKKFESCFVENDKLILMIDVFLTLKVL